MPCMFLQTVNDNGQRASIVNFAQGHEIPRTQIAMKAMIEKRYEALKLQF